MAGAIRAPTDSRETMEMPGVAIQYTAQMFSIQAKCYLRSCTSTLRIIRSARESGKLSPFHDQVRGLCHDSTAIFLPTSGLGTPLVVCDAALRLAQPMRGFTTQAIQASAATAQAFQRPEAVSWPPPHAPLCRLCAGPRVRTPTARWPATPHPAHAGTAAPGGDLAAFLSRSRLYVWWLARLGQYHVQRSSQRWTVAPAALHGLRELFPRNPRHAGAWQARRARLAGVGGGRAGGGLGPPGRGPRV